MIPPRETRLCRAFFPAAAKTCIDRHRVAVCSNLFIPHFRLHAGSRAVRDHRMLGLDTTIQPHKPGM